MESKPLFNAIVIDTNAFDGKGNDFCGYISDLIPSFFQTINQLNLQLISHPILQGETIKHINKSDWKSKPENVITSLSKYKVFLELATLDFSDIITKLKRLNLCEETIAAFQNFFSSAILLPYADPEKIFEKYFSGKSPFAESGNKKSEFPDAFIIESIDVFLKNHPEISVLIVSDDGDWKSAFYDKTNVTLADNLDRALQMLISYEHNLWQLVSSVFHESKEEIQKTALLDVWFNIYDYECEDDIDVESIELESIEEDIVPLKITDKQIVIQATANLVIDGSTTILDYDKSIWDREDHTYIIRSFSIMDFHHATGNVTCEIYIDLDEKKPSLNHIKLIAPHGVTLAIDEEQTTFTEIDFESDTHGDMMDTLEEYYRH
jgi:hypothetical protein